MAATFSRSIRSLAAERPVHSVLAILIALGLLVGWCAWFFFAGVTLFEVSSRARLEVDRAVHPVAASVRGRVAALHLQLGRTVEVGEVLVELDAEAEKRRLDEEQKRLAGLEPELAALRRELTATEDSVRDERTATRSALDVARANTAEQTAGLHFASEQAARYAKLHEKQGISELELLRARAEEQRKEAAVKGARSDVQRIEADQRTKDSNSRARVEQIRRDAAKLEGLIATTTSAIRVLEEEVEKHLLRAPVAGQLGEVAPLQIGSVLGEGDRIASVVPGGHLRLVAQFAPSAALGRIKAGQHARARLDGFPWIQWGSLEMVVLTVGSEPRDGLVRVELGVVPNQPSRIPLAHGLPGTVEIEVERVTPATLLLRVAGQVVSPPTDAPVPKATEP